MLYSPQLRVPHKRHHAGTPRENQSQSGPFSHRSIIDTFVR
jgi:hypothetical protein